MTDNTLILYTTSDGQASVVLRELGGQLWLTQAEMAELYQTSKQNISKHITAVLEEGELLEKAVVNSQLTTAADGKTYQVEYFNLDAIISVPGFWSAASLACLLNTYRDGYIRDNQDDIDKAITAQINAWAFNNQSILKERARQAIEFPSATTKMRHNATHSVFDAMVH